MIKFFYGGIALENSNEKKANKSLLEKLKNENVIEQNRLALEKKTGHKFKNDHVINFLSARNSFSR